VTLERRNGRRLYYYRAFRDGEKVRKVYVGAGEVARICSETDILQRNSRRAQREREKAELERLKGLVALVEQVSEVAKVLVTAHLVDGGYRKRKGEWRRARSA
jgi:hypothetical protein